MKEINKETRMEVTQVLHMNGSVGEVSYANNSLLQVFFLFVEETLLQVYNTHTHIYI